MIALILQWESLFSLEVKYDMLEKKHNLEGRLPNNEYPG